MLEIKHLSKIYKTKKGADVKALDDVSVQFPEKGMVFLLGKSGSGKSTLLNVCGGLDSPTSGEIIVKGRSSKDFSQSDFDSYRNTFVGFIFQEYNILNEFSVEDNIALALELQGKPKDKKAVAELLEQVDLKGYAKRKPNTLSGGQKQRIAIARALVKAPEIIMADEPTGALDSNTGRQVFETLKKLSEDKLVLVVSHDREFAEQYGDRIIELKDGKILSDVSKTVEEQQALSENINTIGDVLCIKKGADLSNKDFEEIKAFLKRSEGDVIIANNVDDVKTFKKASRITDDGEKEVFRETKAPESKTYKPEDSKFIRSKLPVKHAVRIGMSSLKSKPVRLFFTILLCTVAFMLFGLLSTMSFYNSEATFKQTLIDSEYGYVRMGKLFLATDVVYENGEKSYEYESFYEGRFSQSDLEKLCQKFGESIFGGVEVYMNYNLRSSVAPYWINEITTAAYLPKDNSLRDTINGRYPEKKGEICISSYAADVIINCKTYDGDGNALDVSSREELLGKTIQLGKIVGIIESGSIPSKYDALKSAENDNGQLVYELRNILSDGLQFVMFVSEEEIKVLAEQYKPYMGENLAWYRRMAFAMKNQEGEYEFPEWSNGFYAQMSALNSTNKIFYLNGEKELADDEIIISTEFLAEKAWEIYSIKMNTYYEQGNWQAGEKLSSVIELCSQIQVGGIWVPDEDGKDGTMNYFTDEEMTAKINALISQMKKDGISMTLGGKLYNDRSQSVYGDLVELKVIGAVSLNDEDNGMVVLSDKVVAKLWNEQKVNVEYYSEISTKYQEDGSELYSTIYLPYDHSTKQTQDIWDMYKQTEYDENDSRIKPTSRFIDSLAMVDTMVKEMSNIFLYVGLVMAVFAALLLSNFISVSISQKKKEIGILRAVGARSFDVFKIFFSESFFITAVCVALATVGSIVICGVLNTEVAAELGASLFVFGVPSLVVLIAIALVTTILATFLPVWNAARKKPVESIRAL